MNMVFSSAVVRSDRAACAWNPDRECERECLRGRDTLLDTHASDARIRLASCSDKLPIGTVAYTVTFPSAPGQL